MSRATSRRQRTVRVIGAATAAITATALVAFAPTAQGSPREQRDPDPGPARVLDHRVHRGDDTALSPGRGAPVRTVRGYLRRQGLTGLTARSLRATGPTYTFRGVQHLRMEQRVDGLRVHDTVVRAALDRRGRLVHLLENVADVPATAPTPARISPDAALRVAVGALHPDLAVDGTGARRSGSLTTYPRDGFFAAPTVERVAVPTRDGRLAVGFLVETWVEEGNELHETLVSGDGRVLGTELRTSEDRYNVFPVHPEASEQTVVRGPGRSGNPQSPEGWLFTQKRQGRLHIKGNNVRAYLDAVPDDVRDRGGARVRQGQFLADARLDRNPWAGPNQRVAVQNLFYLNNLIHDALYAAGFTEGAGNFQKRNFEAAGSAGDPVRAEAQDGGATDNANFATPRDGRRPRMQMFLWTGQGTHEVVVGGTSYPASGAAWGAELDPTGVTAPLAPATDATAPVDDACEPVTSDVSGKLAIALRGLCPFTDKARNVQDAGATGLIVVNNVPNNPITMGGFDPQVTIPAVMVSQDDGAALLTRSGESATIRLTDPPPLMRDGDVDADIVWHEYGHGLTWRMIGRMSGPMSGAIGEGMSDVLSVIANEDDVVGEYATGDPRGIRSAPYTNYPRSYGDVAGTAIHFDGEVYGAIGWALLEAYRAAGIGKDVLLADLVDGMNYTPPAPAFEDMRDGILAGLQASGNVDRACLVWGAFARYGVGVGATGTVQGESVVVQESVQLPAECP